MYDYICTPCKFGACHRCTGCTCADDDHGGEPCVYCEDPTAGEEGGYYSLRTGLEVCAQSPTTFHERSVRE